MSNELQSFGGRLVTLAGGRSGLRASLSMRVKEAPGESNTFLFIASDETIDRYNEVVRADGWKLDNYRKNPVIVDSHDYSSVGKILGRSAAIDISGKSLVNRVEFAVENPLGSLACKLTRGGFIRAESVGFVPLKWEDGKRSGGAARTYVSQDLLEVSLVVVPANPGATVGLALKSGAIGKRDIREAVAFLQEFCGEEAGTGTLAGASGPGAFDAQAQQLMASLKSVFRGL